MNFSSVDVTSVNSNHLIASWLLMETLSSFSVIWSPAMQSEVGLLG